jgi:hypothetical protein
MGEEQAKSRERKLVRVLGRENFYFYS